MCWRSNDRCLSTPKLSPTPFGGGTVANSIIGTRSPDPLATLSVARDAFPETVILSTGFRCVITHSVDPRCVDKSAFRIDYWCIFL